MRLGHVRVVGAGLVVQAWGSDRGVCATFVGEGPGRGGRIRAEAMPDVEIVPGDDALLALADALAAYLAGARLRWDGHLDLRGTTPFQQDVYRTVRDIPHGELRRYGDVAGALGRPSAVRAVAAALGANPWPIVVPCHRVVALGDLGGYSAGVAAKRALLALEAGQGRLPWEVAS